LNKPLLIIGLGSIGKKHLKWLDEFNFQLYIIDPNPNTREYLSSSKLKSKYVYLSNIEEFRKMNINPYASIISNLGPQHAQSFRDVIGFGCKKILIEKPITSKIKDLREIINLTKKNKVNLRTNFPWVNSGFMDKFEKIRIENKLGSVENILVYGGAKCIITVGIHYLAIAIKIYGSTPTNCWSKLKSDSINPRSPKLKYYQGIAYWEFKNNKSLSINFSNNSRNQAYMIINFQNGQARLEGDSLIINKISNANLSSAHKPTQTFFTDETKIESSIFTDSEGTIKLYQELFDSDYSTKYIDESRIMDSIFGILISNKNKSQLVKFPINGQLIKKFNDHEWLIS
jgi:predicted dehydrogenase